MLKAKGASATAGNAFERRVWTRRRCRGIADNSGYDSVGYDDDLKVSSSLTACDDDESISHRAHGAKRARPLNENVGRQAWPAGGLRRRHVVVDGVDGAKNNWEQGDHARS